MSMIPGFGYILEDEYAEIQSDLTAIAEVIQAQPIPELPAECWNAEKPDGARCVQATRSLCGG